MHLGRPVEACRHRNRLGAGQSLQCSPIKPSSTQTKSLEYDVPLEHNKLPRTQPSPNAHALWRHSPQTPHIPEFKSPTLRTHENNDAFSSFLTLIFIRVICTSNSKNIFSRKEAGRKKIEVFEFCSIPIPESLKPGWPALKAHSLLDRAVFNTSWKQNWTKQNLSWKHQPYSEIMSKSIKYKLPPKKLADDCRKGTRSLFIITFSLTTTYMEIQKKIHIKSHHNR